jgi:phage shock protein PspC (stress-responsive transcriptional regulator)
MNKTISINIGGMIFQIDEEAYKILEQYLESLKQHFATTEGHEEIIQDIEARIGEIFQTRLESGQLLILKNDVEEAIKILGKPGDIGNNGTENETREEPKKTTNKRLFRDEDNRMIAGVCSGLGHYLNIDPIWFRLAFLISIFFAGTGIVVYLVLWIIIPRAITTEERMHMRGSPMTISEIEQNIKSEFEDLKTRFHEMKGNAKRRGRREMHEMKRKMRQAKQEAKYTYYQRYMASTIAKGKTEAVHHHGPGSAFGEIIYYFVRFLLSFVGIVLLVLAIVLTISLVLSFTASDSFLFFTKWGISSVSLPAFSHLFFETLWQQQILIVSLILLIGVPILMLIFNSIRMIIGFRTKNRIVSVTASLLWLCGLILAIVLTLNIVGNFSEKSNVKNEIILPQPRETLMVDVTDNLPQLKEVSYWEDDDNFTDFNGNNHQRFIFNNCFFTNNGKNIIAYGFPKLKIVPSKTDQYKLSIIKYSRGTTLMTARERAEAIRSEVIIVDTSVIINNYFLLPEHEKWRNQSVKIILEVPESKSIFLSKNVDKLIYDRDNIDGSWNFDMTGKKMTMQNGRLVENAEIVKKDSVRIQKPLVKK